MLVKASLDANVMVLHYEETRLDAHVSGEFKQEVARIMEESSQPVVLNLDRVEFIDSSGLGAIISLLKKIERHREMVICGTRDTVSTLFRLTRMDRVFRMFKNEKEAVLALSVLPATPIFNGMHPGAISNN